MNRNFPAEPTPKIDYLSKQNLTAPPPSQNQMVVSLQCVPKAQSITDKLFVVHWALRVAPFTTSRMIYCDRHPICVLENGEFSVQRLNFRKIYMHMC